jgi:ferredoxin
LHYLFNRLELVSSTRHGDEMIIDEVKEIVRTQTKNYRVADILDKFDDSEWLKLFEQIMRYKPYETERRLIDYARTELDFFRYVLYKERHYEDLLIDKACIQCLKCTDECETERKYYVRRPKNT